MSQQPIYLDAQATTPLDPVVLEAMLPYFIERPGNPSSGGHRYGWEAAAAIKEARKRIAEAIAAEPQEIIFTSGATEANNLAIKGVAEAYLTKGRHLITVATEHQAVLSPCRYLESVGFEVTYLSVQGDGLVNLTHLEQAIRADTVLVSIMAANNEIGVLQPISEIGAICRQRGVLFHTDSAQAIAKIPLNVQTLNVDLMSLTAHKIYGPKGVGALYIRRPSVKLAAQIHGGGQENNWRSGTLATPQIVGFAKAVQMGLEQLESQTLRLQALRQKLWHGLESLQGIELNGHPQNTLAGCLNVTIHGVDGPRLLAELYPHLAISSGSACSSNQGQPSHVLLALGRSPALAKASLRFGLGRYTTEAEIDQAIHIIQNTVAKLRGYNYLNLLKPSQSKK
ncbi:cysteine desulfurase [Candidatus Synechococcus calcipolaris G9]|uniref:cysteine desulfurase n=1 Tax=Candidatus Synechococcus calcipolaris G9 TaxID=1497997 RepID=A0ABT6EW13_9SYNE|nr:cysteine desulfurase family protein [Candidatus Synechococcus calcipolaris]MDG2989451.1 cysteine desulfurase [Candidatus Synechococcus calcipolaris G9]